MLEKLKAKYAEKPSLVIGVAVGVVAVVVGVIIMIKKGKKSSNVKPRR